MDVLLGTSALVAFSIPFLAQYENPHNSDLVFLCALGFMALKSTWPGRHGFF